MDFKLIKNIEIKGGCFEQKTSLDVFGTIIPKQAETQENIKNNDISIIYGKNGQGKTTISKIISEINLNSSNCVFKDINDNLVLTETNKENIYVFNEEFVDKNVKLNDKGLKSIIMFGEQVELDNKIKDKEDEKKITTGFRRSREVISNL